VGKEKVVQKRRKSVNGTFQKKKKNVSTKGEGFKNDKSGAQRGGRPLVVT